jgi:hypothetical protein
MTRKFSFRELQQEQEARDLLAACERLDREALLNEYEEEEAWNEWAELHNHDDEREEEVS